MAKTEDKKPAVETAEKADEKAKAPETVPAKSKADEKAKGLVKMQKDDTSLHVHPTTVDAHKAKGWKVA